MWHLSFTHLASLWLGAAAVVPLIIHFFARRRPRQVPFPAVRFVRRSRRKSFRRTRLRQFLLLLLRMALLALFALLLARPVLSRGAETGPEAAAEGTPAAVIVVDDSMSMNYQAGDATWFEVARNRALELAGRLPERAAAALTTTSRPTGKLVRDAAVLQERVASLDPTNTGSTCWRALQQAAEILKPGAASRRDIFLFTDMTESAWIGRERRTVEVGRNVSVSVIDCGGEGAANAAVQELRQRGQVPLEGATVGVEVALRGSGEPSERTVQFELDGVGRGRRSVRLRPGEKTRLRFRTRLDRSGHHGGRVGFLNADGLPQDDARSFTLQVAPAVSVLCVETAPQSGVESPSYFLRLALNPWRGGEKGMFRIERVSPADLEEVPLGPFDAVALVDAAGVGERAWERLNAYLNGGGGLLVFLGPRTESSYRTAAARSVLPAEVGPVVDSPPDSPLRLRIVEPDHAFVRALQESGATLGQVRFRTCRRLQPAPDATELLSFGPDLPALVISELGGRAAVFAATADDRWGLLARTQPYVPFCHELLMHLSRRSTAAFQSVPVGTRVPITYETSRWPTVVYVSPPAAGERERLLPGTTPGKITYWDTEQPGYYRLDFERRDRKWSSGFAVNVPPAESRLEKVPFEELEGQIRAGSVQMVDSASFHRRSLVADGGRWELTPWLAVLGFALLLGESILANRSTTRTAPEGRAN